MRPYKPVLDGYITSPYGERVLNGKTQFHRGIDIGSKTHHAVVLSTYSGEVVVSGYSDSFGFRVWIKNEHNNIYVVYAHLSHINSNIIVGKEIKAGDMIGMMGDTGRSYGQHLHYEERTSPNTTGSSIEPTEVSKLYE